MPDWEETDPRFEPLDEDDDELVLDPWDEPFEVPDECEEHGCDPG